MNIINYTFFPLLGSYIVLEMLHMNIVILTFNLCYIWYGNSFIDDASLIALQWQYIEISYLGPQFSSQLGFNLF